MNHSIPNQTISNSFVSEQLLSGQRPSVANHVGNSTDNIQNRLSNQNRDNSTRHSQTQFTSYTPGCDGQIYHPHCVPTFFLPGDGTIGPPNTTPDTLYNNTNQSADINAQQPTNTNLSHPQLQSHPLPQFSVQNTRNRSIHHNLANSLTTGPNMYNQYYSIANNAIHLGQIQQNSNASISPFAAPNQIHYTHFPPQHQRMTVSTHMHPGMAINSHPGVSNPSPNPQINSSAFSGARRFNPYLVSPSPSLSHPPTTSNNQRSVNDIYQAAPSHSVEASTPYFNASTIINSSNIISLSAPSLSAHIKENLPTTLANQNNHPNISGSNTIDHTSSAFLSNEVTQISSANTSTIGTMNTTVTESVNLTTVCSDAQLTPSNPTLSATLTTNNTAASISNVNKVFNPQLTPDLSSLDSHSNRNESNNPSIINSLTTLANSDSSHSFVRPNPISNEINDILVASANEPISTNSNQISTQIRTLPQNIPNNQASISNTPPPTVSISYNNDSKESNISDPNTANLVNSNSKPNPLVSSTDQAPIIIHSDIRETGMNSSVSSIPNSVTTLPNQTLSTNQQPNSPLLNEQNSPSSYGYSRPVSTQPSSTADSSSFFDNNNGASLSRIQSQSDSQNSVLLDHVMSTVKIFSTNPLNHPETIGIPQQIQDIASKVINYVDLTESNQRIINGEEPLLTAVEVQLNPELIMEPNNQGQNSENPSTITRDRVNLFPTSSSQPNSTINTSDNSVTCQSPLDPESKYQATKDFWTIIKEILKLNQVNIIDFSFDPPNISDPSPSKYFLYEYAELRGLINQTTDTPSGRMNELNQYMIFQLLKVTQFYRNMKDNALNNDNEDFIKDHNDALNQAVKWSEDGYQEMHNLLELGGRYLVLHELMGNRVALLFTDETFFLDLHYIDINQFDWIHKKVLKYIKRYNN